MMYGRCKCGEYEVWTSMGIKRCSWCKKCKSTPAFGKDGHDDTQPPHEMLTSEVETDGNPGQLTSCVHCHKTAKELAGEPMEPWKCGTV